MAACLSNKLNYCPQGASIQNSKRESPYSNREPGPGRHQGSRQDRTRNPSRPARTPARPTAIRATAAGAKACALASRGWARARIRTTRRRMAASEGEARVRRRATCENVPDVPARPGRRNHRRHAPHAAAPGATPFARSPRSWRQTQPAVAPRRRHDADNRRSPMRRVRRPSSAATPWGACFGAVLRAAPDDPARPRSPWCRVGGRRRSRRRARSGCSGAGRNRRRSRSSDQAHPYERGHGVLGDVHDDRLAAEHRPTGSPARPATGSSSLASRRARAPHIGGAGQPGARGPSRRHPSRGSATDPERGERDGQVRVA